MKDDQVLKGKRILVTRPKDQARSLSELITTFSGIPIEIPMIAIETPKDQETIVKTLEKLDTFTWVVFTSANGVEHFFNNYDLLYNEKWQRENRPQIAVVGKKTHAALVNIGVEADLIPHEFIAEGLIEALLPKLTKDDHVLVARGNLARQSIMKQLKDNDIKTTDLIIYETKKNVSQQKLLLEKCQQKEIDMITFTSSSTFYSFLEMVQGYETLIQDIPIACIGPITANSVKQKGYSVEIIPKEYTIEGLVSEIITYFKKGE